MVGFKCDEKVDAVLLLHLKSYMNLVKYVVVHDCPLTAPLQYLRSLTMDPGADSVFMGIDRIPHALLNGIRFHIHSGNSTGKRVANLMITAETYVNNANMRLFQNRLRSIKGTNPNRGIQRKSVEHIMKGFHKTKLMESNHKRLLATVEHNDALSSNHTVNDSFIAKWVSSTVDHGQSTAYQLILEVRAMTEQKKAIPKWVLYASEFMKIPYAAYGHDIKRFLESQTNFSPESAKTTIRQCIDNGGVLGAYSGVNNSHH
jgi:hypothetical protein